MSASSDRRGFLRGLATLPLIGGAVSIIGNPTAAAEPVSMKLLETYGAWLFFERRYLCAEMVGYRYWEGREPEEVEDRQRWHRDSAIEQDHVRVDNPGGAFHFSADPARFPQPSTRAAAVLSAVGCDWRHRGERALYL